MDDSDFARVQALEYGYLSLIKSTRREIAFHRARMDMFAEVLDQLEQEFNNEIRITPAEDYEPAEPAGPDEDYGQYDMGNDK
jgi:hypothetical protein